MNASLLQVHPIPKPEPKERATRRPPMPDAHSDVALADIHDVCALVRMSPSWVHDRVAKGEFPAPVIREPRCTRWQIAHVREHIQKIVNKAAADPRAGDATRQMSKRASDGARSKRTSSADKSDSLITKQAAE